MNTVPIRIYGSATAAGTTNDLASITIPRNGHVVGATIQAVATPGVSADDYVKAQVSFLSTSSFLVNNAQGIIVEVLGQIVVEGTAASIAGVQFANRISGIRIPVATGQIVYLHVDATASGDLFTANIYLEL